MDNMKIVKIVIDITWFILLGILIIIIITSLPEGKAALVAALIALVASLSFTQGLLNDKGKS